MSKALKCDICGSYFDYDSNYVGISISRYNHYDTEMTRKVKTLLQPTDMCPNCYNAIIIKAIDARRKTVYNVDVKEE